MTYFKKSLRFQNSKTRDKVGHHNNSWVLFALLMLGLISGGISLSYEVLWTRELLNLLGSTTRANALVLSTFLAGLAIGAWVVGHLTVTSTRPFWFFVAAEGGLSLIGFFFPLLMEYLSFQVPEPMLLNALLFVLLLFPAFLMGATLPALSAVLQNQGKYSLNYIAGLYGLNTLGGATAALTVGLVLLPVIGLLSSQRVIVVIGLITTLIAGFLATKLAPRVVSVGKKSKEVNKSFIFKGTSFVFFTAVFFSGIAALGYEVLWARVLVLVVGSSTNAFALMLSLYLLGLAAGGLAMGRFIGHIVHPLRVFKFLQLGVAVTAVAGTTIFISLPSLALFGFSQFGTSPASIGIIMGLSAVVIIVPTTIFIGASFPLIAGLMEKAHPQRGREVGFALALTTGGNVIGVLLASFIIIPLVGLQHGIQLLAAVNVLAALILWMTGVKGKSFVKRGRAIIPLIGVSVILASFYIPRWNTAIMTSGVFRQAPVYLALLGEADRFSRVFSGYRTLFYREGQEAVVAVFDYPTLRPTGHRALTIDGKVDASTGADMATQILSGHLPYIFRPSARDVLVVGLASGVTVGQLLNHSYSQIDVVEIEPAVVDASKYFNEASGSPLEDPKVRVYINDGRLFLSRTQKRYDIIVSEPSNPWLSMSSRLFTREFFELARDRLTSGGILVQWVPLYGLSSSQFKSLLLTLLDVFPEVAIFRVAEGDLIAIASEEPLQINPSAINTLFEDSENLPTQRIDIHKQSDLLTKWVADSKGLNEILDFNVINTDDNGYLEFGSPWYILSDSINNNLSFIERASLFSNVLAQIISAWEPYPDREIVLLNLAEQYLSKGNNSAARKIAEKLRFWGHQSEADLLFGDIALVEGRGGQAESIWSPYSGAVFLLRRADLAFQQSDFAKALTLYSRVSKKEFSGKGTIQFAWSLFLSGQTNESLNILESFPQGVNLSDQILTSFIRVKLLEKLGLKEKSSKARKAFENKVDDLRRCLEVDECQGEFEVYLNWNQGTQMFLPEEFRIELQQEILFRVTRPLTVYFSGVRSMWLGETEEAINYLNTYLRLLPSPDPISKAYELINNMQKNIKKTHRD